jgi:hypothetical protein
LGTKPRLAEVQCTKIQFDPGDRLLVKVQHELNAEQRKQLTRTIQKWAGAEVEVLIINVNRMQLEIQKKAAGSLILPSGEKM